MQWHMHEAGATMDKDKIIVVTVSGRGDKDCAAIARYRGRIFMSKIRSAFENGKAFIPFITCGDPNLETTAKIVKRSSCKRSRPYRAWNSIL